MAEAEGDTSGSGLALDAAAVAEEVAGADETAVVEGVTDLAAAAASAGVSPYAIQYSTHGY